MNKELLIILASLTIIAIIVLLFIIPMIDTVSAVGVQLSEAQARIDQINSLSEKIKNLNDKYNQNSEEIKKLMAVLPNEEEMPDLLVQLETLAGTSGLVMESVSFTEAQQKANFVAPQINAEDDSSVAANTTGSQNTQTSRATKPSSYKTSQVTLRLTGGYEAFKNYLVSVEKNERLMDVISLALSAPGQQSGNFSYSLSINVYYQ